MYLIRYVKKTTFLFITGVLLLLLTSCDLTTYPMDHEQLSEEERLVIRFSHVVGEHTPKGLAARRFAELINERSNGKVEVQVFPNGFLYKDGEEMDALLNGDIQMIAPATSKVTSLVPEWSVIDLPFAFSTYKDVHEYLETPIGQQLITKLNGKGLKTLGIWDNGFKQISNRDFPIHHPNDLNQLNMRIMPSDIIEKQFLILGAVPKKIDFNILFHQLENGDVDGQENTLSNITSKNLHALQNYLTISNHGYLGYILMMNDEFWNELPENIQLLITDTLIEVNQWEWEIADRLNSEKLIELENCGCIDIYHLTDKERQTWEEAFKPVYNYYIDRFGAEYIEPLP